MGTTRVWRRDLSFGPDPEVEEESPNPHFGAREALHLQGAAVQARSDTFVTRGTRGVVSDSRHLSEGWMLQVAWESGVADWLTKKEMLRHLEVELP